MDRRSGGGGRLSGLLLFVALSVLVTVAASEARELELRRTPTPGDRHEPAAEEAVPREGRDLGAGFRPQSAPCLLIDTSPRKPEHRRASPGARLTPPNGYYDPASGLPPAVLSPARREQLTRLLQTKDVRTLAADLRGAALRGEGAPADTQRILVLRVDFETDSPGARSSGDGRFDLRDSTDIQFDPPPHDRKFFEKHMEALARYYDVQTLGRLALTYDVYPEENDLAYRLPDTFPYGPWIFSNSNPDVLQHAIDLVGDALARADTTDAAIDFSLYDHFLIVHAGPDFQGDVNRDTPWDIPSFNLFVVDPFVVQDSVQVDLVMVVPETVSQDGFEGALNGVITHEFGHQLGFFDLYDVRVGAPVVGAFSLMDSGDNLFALIEDPDRPGVNRAIRGTLPSSLDPFHKTLWFPDAVDLLDVGERLSGDGTRVGVDLTTVQLGNQIAQVPLNLNEYLLLENRYLDLNGDSTVIVRQDPETGVILGPEPDSTAVADSLAYLEYDWLIPGEGLIAWHVDFLAIRAGLSIPGGGLNVFFSRPGVGLVEADGIRDIGTASSEYLGGPFDPFFRGGYDLLAANTIPSSNTNDGTPSGITMVVLDSIGVRMRASVTSELFPGGWPVRVLAAPDDEQVLVLGLEDEDEPRLLLPAVDQGLGDVIYEISALGESPEVFVFLQDSLDVGLSGHPTFLGPGGREAAVAYVAGGRLGLVDGRGIPWASWPPLSEPEPLATVTTTAVLRDSLAVVGCSDGKVRTIAARGELVRNEFETGAPGAIRALGCGAVVDGGAAEVYWAADDGYVGSFPLAAGAGAGWFRQAWPGATPVSLLVVPDASDRPELVVVWDDGTVDRYRSDGERVAGWPYRMRGTPAADAIVADVDQDGVLETFVLSRDGAVHSIAANGVAETGWPRSLWSEDEEAYEDQRSGPRAFDLDADGAPELVLHRGDGILFAWEADGSPVRGYPLSFGGPGLHGPHVIPSTVDTTPRLVVGNLEGFTEEGWSVESLSAVRARGIFTEGPGFFPLSGVDPARSRVYPAAWRPIPVAADVDIADLRLYPNPLRDQDLTVRFVVGAPTTIELEAFDLDGRSVARTQIAGEPGAGGNQVRWDLSALASGLYHVRVRARDLGFERFERIAIVR